MAVNGIEIAIGQTWRSRAGEEIVIVSRDGDADHPWIGVADGDQDSKESYTEEGLYFSSPGSAYDLTELVSPMPATGDDHQAVTFHALQVVDVPQVDWAQEKRVAHAFAGIGDLTSDAKGSGARFNAGKTPYFLVPLAQIGASFLYRGSLTEAQQDAARALQHIGDYQARASGVEALYKALAILGTGGWAECARVFEYGMAKYAAWNWAKGMPWSVPLECAARHIVDGILAGEDVDPESGKPHRGHIFCNVVMLIAFAETYAAGDDRPAAGLLTSHAAANDASAQVTA
jgi:hypothetical protein